MVGGGVSKRAGRSAVELVVLPVLAVAVAQRQRGIVGVDDTADVEVGPSGRVP